MITYLLFLLFYNKMLKRKISWSFRTTCPFLFVETFFLSAFANFSFSYLADVFLIALKVSSLRSCGFILPAPANLIFRQMLFLPCFGPCLCGTYLFHASTDPFPYSCAVLRIRISEPDFYPSRIQQQQQKRRGKKFCFVLPFFVATDIIKF